MTISGRRYSLPNRPRNSWTHCAKSNTRDRPCRMDVRSPQVRHVATWGLSFRWRNQSRCVRCHLRAATETFSLTLFTRSASQVPRSSGATVAASDPATGSSSFRTSQRAADKQLPVYRPRIRSTDRTSNARDESMNGVMCEQVLRLEFGATRHPSFVSFASSLRRSSSSSRTTVRIAFSS
jgi:hypothetical protein